jgi:hypothetical protein
VPASVNEQLTRYLLDYLSDDDRRAIEERYFADDEFFELISAIEDDLVAAYLEGRLRGRDRRRFEELYSTPAQRQKVDAIRRLRWFAKDSPGKPSERIPDDDRPWLAGLLWFALAPSVRGAAEGRLIEVPVGTTEIGLQLELDEIEDYASYKAHLKRDGEDEDQWTSNDCQIESTGQGKLLLLRLPSDRLNNGDFVLFLKGIRLSGETAELDAYPFRFRRA